ncbi:MAG TPA: amidohydrolase family protein [Roseiflexaceae bacterium]|nr:amidohydrolase family protein [Roseiflexaceae bacterium]
MRAGNRTVALALAALLLAACASAPAPVRPTPPPTVTPVAPAPASPTPAPAPPTPTAAPASATPAATLTAAAPRYDLVLLGGTLIDGTGAPPLPGAVVAILGGWVAAVGPADEVPFAAGTPTRDLRGATILPGFVNAHAHTWELETDALRGWTRAGITTVRDVGGPLVPLVARREALAAGEQALPRLLVSGPIVTVPGGHPIPIYGHNERALAVRGPEDAAARTAALLDGGADLIKIAVSGRTDTGWPELSDEEIRAIVETAHGRGARVTAHVDRAAALHRAVEQGIDDAAHMPRDRMPDELVALMVARGVALVPTIAVYEELARARGDAPGWRQAVLPVMQDNLRRFAAAGGTLALGDDYGNPGVPLGMPMAEIRHWIAAGLTPMQVLVAATKGGAAVCGLAGAIGVLRPGVAADILVVAGDPLADIEVLGRPMLVLHGGQVAYSSALQRRG